MVLLLLVVGACCPVVSSQVVETPKGQLEFVGLERWDIATIAQRLGYEALEKSVCNVRRGLTGKLGFADAYCASYVENGRPYKVITVLEPQGIARIRYLLEPQRRLETPPAWLDLMRIVEAQTFLNTILDYGSTFHCGIAAETLMPAEDRAWFSLLQDRSTDQDFKLALERLAQDGDFRNRVIAVMVLMNFGYRDSAWRALVSGLRDANEIVRATCAQSLLSLVRYAPRRIDWNPAVSDLNALLSGTSLFAYSWVIEVLVRTKVPPELARSLLKGNARELLLAYLGAAHKRERELAHNLLTRLSGKDFGFDSDLWREWITNRASARLPLLLAQQTKN